MSKPLYAIGQKVKIKFKETGLGKELDGQILPITSKGGPSGPKSKFWYLFENRTEIDGVVWEDELSIPKPRFKVGDVVRCVESGYGMGENCIGKIYEVISINLRYIDNYDGIKLKNHSSTCGQDGYVLNLFANDWAYQLQVETQQVIQKLKENKNG